MFIRNVNPVNYYFSPFISFFTQFYIFSFIPVVALLEFYALHMLSFSCEFKRLVFNQTKATDNLFEICL